MKNLDYESKENDTLLHSTAALHRLDGKEKDVSSRLSFEFDENEGCCYEDGICTDWVFLYI